MSKVRVPLHGKPHGYATLDTEATRGAVVGVDLFWPDGAVVSAQALAAAMQAGAEPPAGGGSAVYWRSIQEVPANVRAVAGLTASGFVRRDGDDWSAGPIVNDDLGNASTDGLQEGANNLYFTDQRARDAVGAVTGGVLPVVTGEIDNGQPVFVYADDGSLIYSEIA